MKMKYNIFLSFFLLVVLTGGCNTFDTFNVTDKPFVDQTSVQLYIGEYAGERNAVQLISSPADNSYVWTSKDPNVASVDQTGLIKAVGEGITSIVLQSENDQTVIDVKVQEFIPLEGFEINTNSVIGFWQNTTPIFVTLFPENASDVKIEWTSLDNNVAKVYDNGLIKTLEEGRTTVTAKYGEFEQEIDVWVPAPPIKMNKSGWSVPGLNMNSDDGTIGYSSQQRGDGGGIPSIIDDDVNTYWHARYGSPASRYPHWFIIDLGEEVTIAQVGMARRQGDGRGQKGYQIFTCTEDGMLDAGDPTTWDWEDQGDIPFDANKDGIQVQPVSLFPLARYVKVYMSEQYRGGNDYAMVGDFSVYIFED